MRYALAVFTLIVGLVSGALWGPLKQVMITVNSVEGRPADGRIEGMLGLDRATRMALEACGSNDGYPVVKTIFQHVSSAYAFQCPEKGI